PDAVVFGRVAHRAHDGPEKLAVESVLSLRTVQAQHTQPSVVLDYEALRHGQDSRTMRAVRRRRSAVRASVPDRVVEPGPTRRDRVGSDRGGGDRPVGSVDGSYVVVASGQPDRCSRVQRWRESSWCSVTAPTGESPTIRGDLRTCGTTRSIAQSVGRRRTPGAEPARSFARGCMA